MARMVKTPGGNLVTESEARRLGILPEPPAPHLADVPALGTVGRALAHLGVPSAAHAPELPERVGDVLRMDRDRVLSGLAELLARPELRGAAERCALTSHTVAPFLAGLIVSHG